MSDLINVEKLVADFLRADEEVDDLGLRPRVTTPDNTATPWVRITMLDAADVAAGLERWLEYSLQLDIYASDDNGQPEVALLNRTVRRKVKSLEGTTRDGAVIARVRFTANPRVPDGDFEPARERFVLDTRLLARAA